MRKPTLALVVMPLLVVCIILAGLKFKREIQLSEETSYFNSVSHQLSQHPEYFSLVDIPLSPTWQKLDEKASARVMETLVEMGSVDVRRQSKGLSHGAYGPAFKIQVIQEQNGSCRVRVVTPGPDRRFGSADDQVFDSHDGVGLK
jgi:hypothetical protein